MSNLECVDLKYSCIQFYTKLLLCISHMMDVFLVTYAIIPNSQSSVEKLCLVVSSFHYSPSPQLFTGAAPS